MQLIIYMAIAWIEKLIELDKHWFQNINSVYTNSFLDAMLPWYRESTTWLPLYIFILVFLIQNFGRKTAPWVVFALFNILLSDQVSSTFFKHYFMRIRPCADSYLQFHVRLLLDHCSGGYSFTSSHATNHFGFAVFLIYTLKPVINPFKIPLLLWAGSIAYAQVYVGVHYPLDVIVGALLGCFLGYMVASFYNRRVAGFYPLIIAETPSL